MTVFDRALGLSWFVFVFSVLLMKRVLGQVSYIVGIHPQQRHTASERHLASGRHFRVHQHRRSRERGESSPSTDRAIRISPRRLHSSTHLILQILSHVEKLFRHARLPFLDSRLRGNDVVDGNDVVLPIDVVMPSILCVKGTRRCSFAG